MNSIAWYVQFDHIPRLDRLVVVYDYTGVHWAAYSKCMRCGQGLAQPCINLSIYRRTAQRVPMVRPHARRTRITRCGRNVAVTAK